MSDVINDEAVISEAIVKVLERDPDKPMAAKDIRDFLLDYTHIFNTRDPASVSKTLPRMRDRDIVWCYNDTFNHCLVWIKAGKVLVPPQYHRQTESASRNPEPEGNLFKDVGYEPVPKSPAPRTGRPRGGAKRAKRFGARNVSKSDEPVS
jgi:hypothetical protein